MLKQDTQCIHVTSPQSIQRLLRSRICFERNRKVTPPLPLHSFSQVSSPSPQHGNMHLQHSSSNFRFWQSVSKVFAVLSDHPCLLNKSTEVQWQRTTREGQQKRLCPSAVFSGVIVCLKDCIEHNQIPFLFATITSFFHKKLQFVSVN